MALKLAVVGLGGIAQKGYLPVLSSWEGIELFLCTRNEEKLTRVKDQYRVSRATTDLQELIGWRPDAVCILASTAVHYELAKLFLEADIDVFLEKPTSRTIAETKELAQLADNKKLILMTAFNRRFAPITLRLKKLTEEHTFKLAYFQKNRPKNISPDFGIHNRDGIIHLVDLMRYLLGEGKVLLSAYGLDTDGAISESSATIKLDHGGLAVISSSLHAGKWLENVEMHGDTSSVFLNQFRKLEYVNAGEQQIWEQPYDISWESNLVGRGIVGELQHFFECVKTRQQPLTNAWDSLKSQELVEEIIEKSILV